MKRGLIILTIVLALVAVGTLTAVAVTAAGPIACGVNPFGFRADEVRGGWYPYGMGGMMSGNRFGGAYRAGVETGSSPVGTLEEAEQAFERYVARLDGDDLVVTEVMRFERNDYAIVAEHDTDIGAFELLLDRATGIVTPEPGPNMMWNTRYGMHGRNGGMGMWRGWPNDRAATVDAEQATQIAQRWLDEHLPGRQAGTADAFYGYYTLHYLVDEQIDGMLSVNAATGEVWQHSWHGAFIEMTEHED